eukprot:TRINITY_DN1941_c2_g1_i1.p1 TRINITY_DN1941_c2_g1~~TRINITY_DN1941_c2_g1_i1.p1  ORF type:complete len:975 (+),score=259.60 TRINITY_DN1941_c2_g1_i1:65-2926(+)
MAGDSRFSSLDGPPPETASPPPVPCRGHPYHVPSDARPAAPRSGGAGVGSGEDRRQPGGLGGALKEWRRELLRRRCRDEEAVPSWPLRPPSVGDTGLRFESAACLPLRLSADDDPPDCSSPPTSPGSPRPRPATPRSLSLAAQQQLQQQQQQLQQQQQQQQPGRGRAKWPRVVYKCGAAIEPGVADEVAAWEQSLPEAEDCSGCGLTFDAAFESGNLKSAIRIDEREYELEIREDFGTQRYSQWFHFSVGGLQQGASYTFRIINLVKPRSLFGEGLRPLCRYCTCSAERLSEPADDAVRCECSWCRVGTDISYSANKLLQPKKGKKAKQKNFFTLSFTFVPLWPKQGAPQRWFFARCFPYSWTDLQRYLRSLAASRACLRRKVLCDTLAGNACDVLTITAPAALPGELERRPVVVFSARVHPGETMSSWVMQGLLDFIVGDSAEARQLRQMYVFTVVPMLNPDGVIAGNFRCSLFPSDLNRIWRHPDPEYHPTIHHLKALIERLAKSGREVRLFVDFHGHTRKRDAFVYGVAEGESEDGRLFPRLLQEVAPTAFMYTSSSFKVEWSKRGTGRVVMWRELGVPLSYTMETSFAGPSHRGTVGPHHFTETSLMKLGKDVGVALWRYSQPDGPTRAKELIAADGQTADESSSDGSTSLVASEDGEQQVKAARGGRLQRLRRSASSGAWRRRRSSEESVMFRAISSFTCSARSKVDTRWEARARRCQSASPTRVTSPEPAAALPPRDRDRSRGRKRKPLRGGLRCAERAQARERAQAQTDTGTPAPMPLSPLRRELPAKDLLPKELLPKDTPPAELPPRDLPSRQLAKEPVSDAAPRPAPEPASGDSVPSRPPPEPFRRPLSPAAVGPLPARSPVPGPLTHVRATALTPVVASSPSVGSPVRRDMSRPRTGSGGSGSGGGCGGGGGGGVDARRAAPLRRNPPAMSICTIAVGPVPPA